MHFLYSALSFYILLHYALKISNPDKALKDRDVVYNSMKHKWTPTWHTLPKEERTIIDSNIMSTMLQLLWVFCGLFTHVWLLICIDFTLSVVAASMIAYGTNHTVKRAVVFLYSVPPIVVSILWYVGTYHKTDFNASDFLLSFFL